MDVIEWASKIPVHDLSDGRGLCRVIFAEDFLNALKDLPSAQPELIRCKDCKHRPIATRADEGVLWGFSVEFPDERCPLQCEDGWYNYYPKDDFYCANAERSEP